MCHLKRSIFRRTRKVTSESKTARNCVVVRHAEGQMHRVCCVRGNCSIPKRFVEPPPEPDETDNEEQNEIIMKCIAPLLAFVHPAATRYLIAERSVRG